MRRQRPEHPHVANRPGTLAHPAVAAGDPAERAGSSARRVWNARRSGLERTLGGSGVRGGRVWSARRSGLECAAVGLECALRGSGPGDRQV